MTIISMIKSTNSNSKTKYFRLVHKDDISFLKESLRRLLVPLISKVYNEKPPDLIEYCANYFDNLREESKKNSSLTALEEACNQQKINPQQVDKKLEKEMIDQIKVQGPNLQGSASFPMLSDTHSTGVKLRETSSWNHPTEAKKVKKHRRKTLYNKADFIKQMGDQLDVIRENRNENVYESKDEIDPHMELKSSLYFEDDDYPYHPLPAEDNYCGKNTSVIISEENRDDLEYIPIVSSTSDQIDFELRDLVNQASSSSLINLPNSSKYRKKWVEKELEHQLDKKLELFDRGSRNSSSSSDSVESEEGSDYDEGANEPDKWNMKLSSNSTFQCESNSNNDYAELSTNAVGENSPRNPKLNFAKMNDLVHSFSMTFHKLIKDLRKAELFLKKQTEFGGTGKKSKNKKERKITSVSQITTDDLFYFHNETIASNGSFRSVVEKESEKNKDIKCKENLNEGTFKKTKENTIEETVSDILDECVAAATEMNFNVERNYETQNETPQYNETETDITSAVNGSNKEYLQENNSGITLNEFPRNSNQVPNDITRRSNNLNDRFKNEDGCNQNFPKTTHTIKNSEDKNENGTVVEEQMPLNNVCKQRTNQRRRERTFSYESKVQPVLNDHRTPVDIQSAPPTYVSNSNLRVTARVLPTMALPLMGEQGDVPPYIHRLCSVGTETDSLRPVSSKSNSETRVDDNPPAQTNPSQQFSICSSKTTLNRKAARECNSNDKIRNTSGMKSLNHQSTSDSCSQKVQNENKLVNSGRSYDDNHVTRELNETIYNFSSNKSDVDDKNESCNSQLDSNTNIDFPNNSNEIANVSEANARHTDNFNVNNNYNGVLNNISKEIKAQGEINTHLKNKHSSFKRTQVKEHFPEACLTNGNCESRSHEISTGQGMLEVNGAVNANDCDQQTILADKYFDVTSDHTVSTEKSVPNIPTKDFSSREQIRNEADSTSNDWDFCQMVELIDSMEANIGAQGETQNSHNDAETKMIEGDKTQQEKTMTANQSTEPGWTSACGDFASSPPADSNQLNDEDARTVILDNISNVENSLLNDGRISREFVENAIREALEVQSKCENCMDYDYFCDSEVSSDECSSDLSYENISDENNDL